MGFFRMLFAYLMRNEQLINKLADSKPIRRSAQFIAYLLIRSKTHGIRLPFKREEFTGRLRHIAHRFKNKLEEVKDDTKKNSQK